MDEFNFRHACRKEITDKRDLRHNCYIATATQNLKELRHSSPLIWTYK